MTKKLFIWVILVSAAVSTFTQSVDTAWAMKYSGPGDAGSLANPLTVDNSGNVYLTGSSQRSGSNSQYAIIKQVQLVCCNANKGGVVDVGGMICLTDCLFKGGPKLES